VPAIAILPWFVAGALFPTMLLTAASIRVFSRSAVR
jgi:hypothetical protein